MDNEATMVMNDNSIGRLYNIIKNLKDTNEKEADKCFCKVFLLDNDDRVSIFSSYAELFKLCNLGIGELEELNSKNIDKYKRTMNNVIEGLVKIDFTKGYNSEGMMGFRRHFTGELMVALEYCADYLSDRSAEEIIEDDEIQQLIKEINDMTEEVMTSKLNDDLEKILIYELNNMRESLLKYKFYGSKGIETSISTTLGNLILNREKVNDMKGYDIVNRVFKIIANINSIINFSKNSMNLFESVCEKIISIK